MNTAKELFTKVLSRAADSTKQKSGLFGLLSDHTITLKNLLFSAVVVGLELLLSSKVFDCPLNNHVLYGVAYLVFPFLIVLIMNVLLVGKPWDITDRCYIQRYRRRRRRRRRQRTGQEQNDENRKSCSFLPQCLSGEFCYWVCPNITKAFVGPCVWLIASFADSKYFVCAVVGQDIEKRNLTNVTEIKELEAEFADAKARSVIAAWIVLLVLVAGTAIVMTTKKCCLKDNVLLEDEYILDRREAIAALVTFRHYIEHPGEHGDVGNGDVKIIKPQASSQSPSASRAVTSASVSAPSSGASRAAGGESNSDSTTITTKSGGAAGEDKKDGIIATSPGTSARGTDTGVLAPGSGPIASGADAVVPELSPIAEASASSAGTSVSVPGSGPIASSADAIVPAPSPNVEASASSACTSVSVPSPIAGEDKKENKKKEEKKKDGMIIGWFKKILGVGQDKERDEEKGIVGRFIGKEEEILLYPEGIPEQLGKKKVEEMFQGWSKKDGSWHHLEAYRKFQRRYPRVTNGRPCDAWVESSDDDADNPGDGDHRDGTQEGTAKIRGHPYSRIKGKMEETSSV